MDLGICEPLSILELHEVRLAAGRSQEVLRNVHATLPHLEAAKEFGQDTIR